MKTELFWSLVVANILWLAVMACLAYRDNTLWVSQMLSTYPGEKGIVLSEHWGIIMDVPLFGPTMAFIIASSYEQWGRPWIVGALIVGCVISVLAHQSWLTIKTLDALVCRGRISPAGGMHVFYFAVGTAITLLWFFQPNGAPTWAVLLVGAALITHFFFGTHLFLGVRQLFSYQEYRPDGLIDGGLIPFAALTALVVGGTTYKLWAAA